MKDDIRKKFLDMLFEPVEEEEKVVAEGQLTDVSPFEKKTENKEIRKEISKEEKKEVKEEKPKPSKTVSAKEYLYQKSIMDQKYPKDAKKSSFIFLEDDHAKPKEKAVEEKKEEYVLTTNLSPMFGVLDKEKEKEEKVNMSPDLKKNFNSYLGTVISPIYGTSLSNDYGNSINLDIRKVDKYFEPFIEEEIPEPEPDPAVINDRLTDEDNVFIQEDIEEEFEKVKQEEFGESKELNDILSGKEPIKEEKIDDSIYRQVLNEERGFSNTSEIDLFEDLFKEDED